MSAQTLLFGSAASIMEKFRAEIGHNETGSTVWLFGKLSANWTSADLTDALEELALRLNGKPARGGRVQFDGDRSSELEQRLVAFGLMKAEGKS